MAEQPRKKRNGLTIRAYLGCCLRCRHGVYDGDNVVRGRGQQLGLLHEACARAAESAVSASEADVGTPTKDDGDSGAQEAVG